MAPLRSARVFGAVQKQAEAAMLKKSSSRLSRCIVPACSSSMRSFATVQRRDHKLRWRGIAAVQLGRASPRCAASGSGSRPETLSHNLPSVSSPHFDPQRINPEIPIDAAYISEIAHNRIPIEKLLTEDALQRMELMLKAGPLREVLSKKMDAAKREHGDEKKCHLRIGLVSQTLGPIQAVLELWPAGHSSHRHQHEGSASSLRLLHGSLWLRHFDSLESFSAVHIEGHTDQFGDINLEDPAATWMNSSNWRVHEVEAPESCWIQNPRGFALLMQVYLDSSDEISQGSDRVAKRYTPEADFLWHIDTLDAAPSSESLKELADAWYSFGLQGGGKLNHGVRYLPAQCYEKCIEVNEEDARAWCKLGDIGGSKRHGPKECYTKALSHNPELGQAWLQLYRQGGDVYIGGSYYTAKDCLVKHLHLQVSNSDAWFELGSLGGGTIKGAFYSRRDCCMAAKLFSRTDVMRLSLACVWTALEGASSEVIAQNCRDCLEEDESFSWAWCYLGLIRCDNFEVQGREWNYWTWKQCLEKCLELDPENTAAWYALGESGGGSSHGHQVSAVECFQKCLEVDHRHAAAWYALGRAGGGKVRDQMHDSRSCYQKTVEANPANADAWCALGDEGGSPHDSSPQWSSLECYRRSLDLGPATAKAWRHLGHEIWFSPRKLKRFVSVADQEYSARKCYIKSLELDDSNPWIWLYVGEKGMISGKSAEVGSDLYTSKGCFRKCLELAPDNAWAKRLIDEDEIYDEEDLPCHSSEEWSLQCLNLDPKNAMAWRILGGYGGGSVNGSVYSETECEAKYWELVK